MALTAAQRSTAAKIAANTRWSREDPTAQVERMRAGLDARFEREVDPDGTLPPAERARRVESARTAYYQRLQLQSSKARARNAARQQQRAAS